MDRVRELCESLAEAEGESPWLQRLRARARGKRLGAGLAALSREILGEMAAALGRSESYVAEALLGCERIGREIDRLRTEAEPDREALSSAVAEFNRLREVAERRRWELMVQREALGMRRHELLEQLYPIPARRALDAGNDE